MTRFDEPIIATADGLRASLEQVITLTSFASYSAGLPHDIFNMNEDLVAARDEHSVALEALLTTVETANSINEQTLLPLIMKTIASMEECVAFDPSVIRTLIDHIDHLIDSAPCDVTLQRLAHMQTPEFRILVVKYLKPENDAHLDILRILLTDVSEVVRTATHHTLRQGGAPWWFRWFHNDPFLCAELELKQHTHLSALRQTLTTSFLTDDEILACFASALSELPDTLVVEFASFALIDGHAAFEQGELLGAKLLRTEQGRAVVGELLVSWSLQENAAFASHVLATMLTALPDAENADICLGLLAQIDAAPLDERARIDTIPTMLATAIAQAWPSNMAPTLLLDTLDNAPNSDEHFDACALQLTEVLLRLEPESIPWARLIHIPMHGFPGAWATAEHVLAELFMLAPVETTAPLMRQLLEQESDGASIWALERILIDGCWDQTPTQATAQFLSEPRLRRLIFASSEACSALLPRLRGLLAAGECNFREAAAVMQTLRETHGGFIQDARELMFKDLVPALMHTPEDPFLSPGPTPEEWAMWNTLRHAAERDSAFWSSVLTLLPQLDWSEEDHCILDDAWLCREQLSVMELAAALVARNRDIDRERLTELLENASGYIHRMLSAIANSTP